MYDLQETTYGFKVYAPSDRNKTAELHVKTGTLYLLKNNEFQNHIGIDQSILFAKKLHYHYIAVRHGNKKLQTTRKFFQRNGIYIESAYKPTVLFVHVDKFGLVRAMEADLQTIGQMDIFDIGEAPEQDQSRLLKLFEMKLEREANNE